MEATPSAESELTAELNLAEETARDLIFQLAASSNSTRARALRDSISSQLTHCRAALRRFEELAEEQDRSEDSDRLIQHVSERKRAYQSLQLELRNANLQVVKNAQQVVADERKALLGSSDPIDRQRRLESETELASAAEDITASLQRTRQQMSQELEHTSATLAAMEVSDAALKAARDEFTGQKSSHKRSHKLLSTMRRHSVLDFLTLWGGITMFLLTVAYIVAKRSIHFVPQSARNLVAYPFRSRNSTVTSPPSPPLPSEIPEESSAIPAADLKLLEEAFQDAGDPEVEDIGTSLDANAGLHEADVVGEETGSLHQTEINEEEAGLHRTDVVGEELVKREAAKLARAFEEHLQEVEAQQGAAYPGAWGGTASPAGMQMQAQTAPSEGANSSSLENRTSLVQNFKPGNTSQPELSAKEPSQPSEEGKLFPYQLQTIGKAETKGRATAVANETSSGSGQSLAASEEEVALVNGTAEDLQQEDREGLEPITDDREALGKPEGGNLNASLDQLAGKTDLEPVAAHDGEEMQSPSLGTEDLLSEAQEALQSDSASDREGMDVVTAASSSESKEAEAAHYEDKGNAFQRPSPEPWKFDDSDFEYQEPERETSTEVAEDQWLGSQEKEEVSGPTTRQEDTELGIFRPDQA